MPYVSSNTRLSTQSYAHYRCKAENFSMIKLRSAEPIERRRKNCLGDMITRSWDASGLPALRLREGDVGLVSLHIDDRSEAHDVWVQVT